MNPDKTPVIWIDTRLQLAFINITLLTLHDDTVITLSACVRNLGMFFCSEMSMTEHVNYVTRCHFYKLRQLHFIRWSFTQDAAKMFIHATF